MDIGWIMLNPKSTKLIYIWIYSHFCSEACCAPASSSSLLWGKASKLRVENLRGATSSDWQVTLKSSEIIRNHQSSDIHEQPFEHGRIHWQLMQHGDTWTTLDYDFSIFFCRHLSDSTLPPCQDTTKFRLGDIQQLAASATQGHRDLWDVDGRLGRGFINSSVGRGWWAWQLMTCISVYHLVI
jgi:hypothetical protein